MFETSKSAVRQTDGEICARFLENLGQRLEKSVDINSTPIAQVQISPIRIYGSAFIPSQEAPRH